MRLAKLLRDTGLDVNVQGQTIFCADPLILDRVCKVLKPDYRLRKLTASSLQVVSDRNLLAESDEEEDDADNKADMDNLVAAWRSFMTASEEHGYRKAGRWIRCARKKNGKKLLQSALQLADYFETHGESVPQLFAISTVIRKAVAGKDYSRIQKMLKQLSVPKDNKPKMSRYKREAAMRQAVRLDDSSYRFLQRRLEGTLVNARDLFQNQQLASRLFDEWFDTLPDNVDRTVAKKSWNNSLSELKSQQKVAARQASVLYHGDESGGVICYDALPVDRTAGRILAREDNWDVSYEWWLIGSLIEFYAGKVHPEDLTLKHVKRFLSSEELDDDPEDVFEALHHVVSRGIPSRDGAWDESMVEDVSSALSVNSIFN